MNHYDLIRDRLDECHVMFPSYGDRGVKELDVLAGIFAKDLDEFSDSQINAAFTTALRGKSFPVLGDIIGAIKDQGPTQAQIDERKYQCLKAKERSPSWFLNSTEERFLEKYERDNPQIANQKPKYLGFVEDEQLEIERGGSGFRQIGRAL